MAIDIFIADYTVAAHADAICSLLNDYAKDPMGGGEALSDAVLQALVPGMAAQAGAFTVLCFVDDQAAGLVNSFQGYSTFKAKPLINIHDVTVRADFRGLGLSRKMIAAVEAQARHRGCCKLTLEVLEGNSHAADAYRRFGFAEPEAAPELGKTYFMNKPL